MNEKTLILDKVLFDKSYAKQPGGILASQKYVGRISRPPNFNL